MKSMNAFNPTEKEKNQMKQMDREYKYKCWLPESIFALCDTWVYYNDLEADFEDYKWIGEAIKNHPYWIKELN